ncbi:MAG TPA: amino acid ABC transporter substrate-binding protein, partial [Candidatus Dormibacteraeota bacterium]|nr:amino acid ABC transporter substrate-binding protein [Candidatus Dormibacteraeota bacterium]
MIGPRPPAFLFPLAITVILAGCTSEAVRPYPQGDPIVIGAPLALTGSLSDDGQMAQEGYYFCRNWVNAKGGVHVQGSSRPLVIDVQDDQSRASVSAAVTERLISQDHVRLLLGPVGNLLADRDATVAESHQVPILLSSSAESTFNRQYQYVFGVASPASHYLQGVVDMALTLTPAPQSAAILFARDSFSTEVANDLNAYAATKGLSVVYFESFPGGTNDLRGTLGAIGATAPDLVLGVGAVSDTVVTMEAARQLNVHPRLFAFTSGPGDPEFLSDLKQAAEYVYGSTQWAAGARLPIGYFLDGKTYAAQYLAAYGHRPDAYSAAATAGCLALEVAIERAGSTEPQAVRSALAALDLQTFYGEIRFDSRGLNVFKPMEV